MFSARSSFDLAPNRLAIALQAARASGQPVLDLTESNPTRAAIPYDEAAVLQALGASASLVYEPAPFGLPSARDAVGGELARCGVRVEASRVALTSSTSEAYADLFKLLCDPGDEVLVPRPSYPLFEHLAQLEAVRAVPYAVAYDGAWHVDTASVRAAVTDRTRAVVAVSPNNPTGSYLKRDELRALASLGLPIISDEVFASYPLRDDAARVTSALDAAEAPLVFALGGLSKLAALPQMKVAWIAVGGEPRRVEHALARLEIVTDAFLSVATPVQHALPHLLAAGRAAADAIRARTRSNLAWLVAAARSLPVTVLDVEGGWYATLRLPRTLTEEEWTVGFIARDGVYVHPGHFFDFADEPYVVLSLLTPEPTFRAGAARVLERVTRDA
jgi:aspartate/methionine/tyrosine aminotransferase